MIAAAKSHLLAQLSTRDLPGPAGMSTAATDRQAALFLWETVDGRFCDGSAMANGGAITTTCTAAPGDTAFSSHPTVIRLVSIAMIRQHHVIGADRETVLSVTCNGTPLALRWLASVLHGRRPLYAFDLPAQTGGRVTVTVSRANTIATEHVNLIWKVAKGRPTCR
ncbi:hypothetical protein [Streptomyces sp. CA-106110]|uniref:hypothetical protein n=1 Tax=Streptomyces sp. CA-106110 TaxID=3240044 RepID=UPI003D8E7ECC